MWPAMDIPSGDIPLEKTGFPFASWNQLQIASWLGLNSMSTSPLSAGLSSGLNLRRSCVCCHSVWVHMCINPVISGFSSSITSSSQSFYLLFLQLWGEMFRLGLSASKSLTSPWCLHIHTHCLVVSLFVNSHLLQEKAFLKRDEWCSTLWI